MDSSGHWPSAIDSSRKPDPDTTPLMTDLQQNHRTVSAPLSALTLPARVRLPDATQTLADLMARGAAQTGPLRLSLSGLQDSDSSVLAVLLALRRARGGALEIQDIPERVSSLARLYGVEGLLFGQTP